MKRIFYFVTIMLCAALFCACEQTGQSAKAIIGHTYYAYGDNPSNYLAYTFHSNGKATVIISDNQGVDKYEAFTFSITHMKVVLYYDLSDYWKPEFRGKEYKSLVYDPEEDQLVQTDGTVFERAKGSSSDPSNPTEPTGDIDKSKGVLPGRFSVSSTKKVRFSKGNLQYIASTQTWRFADEQYEYLGEANNGALKRDLFGWGTGDEPMKNSQDVSDYAVFHEWGNNTISNGQGVGGWHTLSQEEWWYLANHYEWHLACVAGTNGIIILPDDWNSDWIPNEWWNSIANLYSESPITAEHWKQFENHGAVFFPASGIYDNSKTPGIIALGKQGEYWSTTTRDDLAQTVFGFLVSESGFYAKSITHRCTRCSVRLVTERQ